MKDANLIVFKKVVDFVKGSSVGAKDLDKVRFLKTTVDERFWLKNLKIIQKEIIVPRVQSFIFTFNEAKYFGFVGAPRLNDIPSGFSPIEINAGMFTALVSDLNLQLRQYCKPNELIQFVLAQHAEMPDYRGHDLEDVVGFFESILIFEIGSEVSVLSDNLARLTSFFESVGRNTLSLDFSSETLHQYQLVILHGHQSIPYHNILHSIYAVNRRHSFLELYKCLEYLFSIYYVRELHRECRTKLDVVKFAELLEFYISWKPREEGAVCTIFAECPNPCRELMSRVQARSSAPNMDMGKWFYSLRNSIVHFRPATQSLTFEDADWDVLTRATLMLIEDSYHRFWVNDGVETA